MIGTDSCLPDGRSSWAGRLAKVWVLKRSEDKTGFRGRYRHRGKGKHVPRVRMPINGTAGPARDGFRRGEFGRLGKPRPAERGMKTAQTRLRKSVRGVPGVPFSVGECRRRVNG